MRVNLIGNFNSNGLQHDAMILRGILAHVYGGDVSIRKVQHVFPECSEAELNIFIESVNPSLLPYAAKNIWIPNPEWTYKTWIPYISMMDEIWAKTREAETIFKEYSDSVRYIGWTSIDKALPPKKNYHRAIALVGKNMYRNPKPIIQAYYTIKQTYQTTYPKLPLIYIPYHSDTIKFHLPGGLEDKVVVMSKFLDETEYDELLHECGLAICTSATEGFGHAVNEAMSAGCNLILSPIQPFRELTEEKAMWLGESRKVDHPTCLSSLTDVSVDSLVNMLRMYVDSDYKARVRSSEKSRKLYEAHHSAFIERMKPILESYKTMEEYVLRDSLPKESELPDISIVTLTHNRRLFMPLAKYSYMIQSYPEEKLEWVIVDDGEDSIEDTLFGIPNVKYVRLDTKTSIGEKRNIGVQNAMYDTVVMMDDDDVYPNNSILHRVAMMMKSPAKQCSFTTTIPCYDIQKYSSFMNIPPNTLPMSQRVSEATLCFTKQFWEQRKFTNIQVAEGDAFIHGREQMCRELSPQNVIVSLVHSKNTSSRKIPDGEPNGCHYGFNEKLFALVSEIGEALNTSCRTESGGGGGASSCETSCGDGRPQEEQPHQPPQPSRAPHHHAS